MSVLCPTFLKSVPFRSAYGLGTPELMYNAFRTAAAEDGSVSQFPGVDVGAVFDSYVQNPGAPVVNVDVNHDTGAITVTQVCGNAQF